MENKLISVHDDNLSRSRSRLTKVAATSLLLLVFPFVLAPTEMVAARLQNPPTQIEAGRKLFAGSCSNSYCHGTAGAGGGGPKLKDREFTVDHLTRVITAGIPGTTMPGFKGRYNEEQLTNIVAYVLSLSPNNPNAKMTSSRPGTAVDPHLSGATPKATTEKKPSTAAPSAESKNVTAIPSPSSDLRGDAMAGRELFFDSAQVQNCRVCHTIQGIGGKVGPDLSKITDKPAREILQSIISPGAAIDAKYVTVALTTKDGARFVGVKRDEDTTMIRVYDTSSLPPVSRAFLKSEMAKIENIAASAMPGDYGSKYSRKQLLDLVTFLKSADPAKPVSVSLKELF
jgi:putative heme-binding domain-containing protein